MFSGDSDLDDIEAVRDQLQTMLLVANMRSSGSAQADEEINNDCRGAVWR